LEIGLTKKSKLKNAIHLTQPVAIPALRPPGASLALILTADGFEAMQEEYVKTSPESVTADQNQLSKPL